MNCWIDDEMETIRLGDKRLDKRAKKILKRAYDAPQSSISGSMESWSEVMAAYRFFDNEKVTVEAIMAPHAHATLKRVQAEKKVIVIQDTTEGDYTSKKKLEGKGPLNSEKRQGFLVHTSWVINEHRTPLGVWHSEIYAREGLHEAGDHKSREFEDKESSRWLRGYLEACELAKQAPGVQVISVSDREGDIYEVYEESNRRQEPGQARAEWVIRCCQKHRAVMGGQFPKLQQEVENAPVIGTISFEISSKEQLKKIKGNRKIVHREGRHVEQHIRVQRLQLKPPAGKGAGRASLTIWAVSAKEINPPQGQEPIDWLILTSMPIETMEQAREILEIYMARWEIEVFHRVLKTGCKVEELQHKDADRLLPALALYMIVTWRLLFLTKMGRECPELPCDVLFTEAEWKSITVICKGYEGLKSKPTLQEIIKMIAKQGGYLGRKCDGPPGPQTMWIGLACLKNFALAWMAFNRETG